VGKSTLLNRILDNYPLKTGGFRTLPFENGHIGRGFYLAASDEVPVANPKPERIIALRAENGRLQQFTGVFETLGVAILSRCLANIPDLIIMDELGFIENEALNFQELVFRCLDLPALVLGVIKPLSTPFLDCIRARRDVATFTVTPANREELFVKLRQQVL